MQCEKHGIEYHTLCSECMMISKYGAGPKESYYPPGGWYEVATPDMVNSPSHYTKGRIECIEAITEVVQYLDGMEAMCTGNAIKYLWRWRHKNGVEDLKKAVWYIQRMIDEFDTK